MISLLEAAFHRRQSLLTSPSTTAFRWFGGEREGISGVTLDGYGKVGVLNFYQGKSTLTDEKLKEFAAWWGGQLSLEAIYLKTFVSDRSSQVASEKHYEASPYWGIPVAPEIVIQESGLSFLIRPYAGYSTGLFLDQRANRAFLGSRSRGRKVLNGFAYTCGFSVACAAAGASGVTSVDLSKKYLEWGKRNFELNNLDSGAHRFVASDVLEYFGRLRKRKETFDLIILDPPSFGRIGKGKVFSLQRQLGELWESAMTCLNAGGELYFSCNYADWTAGGLDAEIKKMASRLKPFSKLELPEVPADFALDWNPVSRIFIRVK